MTDAQLLKALMRIQTYFEDKADTTTVKSMENMFNRKAMEISEVYARFSEYSRKLNHGKT